MASAKMVSPWAMDNLPVNDVLPALLASLAVRPNAVLVAPPGAGKTTLVPLALRAQFPGKILLLEPRRLAARAAATRMASLLGEAVGGRVGFRTRLESAVSAATKIEVITEGLLTSRLLADPGLNGVDCVIFDEIHERRLDADLALALVLDLQKFLRPELRLLAMSATADTAHLAGYMNAALLTSDGRAHEVKIEHMPGDIPSARELPQAAARAVRAALAAHAGDILVFLPGMAEIRRTQAELAGCPALVLPLHGDLSLAAQDLALTQHEQRRVVLATSIAETSLTVPGVRIVVDGGFRRAPRLDTATGLARLATLRISRAAATQRAGRAGRLGPGVAIRLWSEALHRGLPPFERAEIFEAELSGLVLACAAWGAKIEDLAFVDTPPAGAVTAGRVLLANLGALDDDNRLTQLGRQMAKLRATPRLAAMMARAQTQDEKALAAALAAILEERDMLGRDAYADIHLRLAALAGQNEGADRTTLARIRQAAGIYRSRLGVARDAKAEGDAGALLAAAYPDRVGQARGEPGAYRLAGGGAGHLNPADPLARARLIVAPALQAKGSRITLAAALNPAALPEALQHRLTRSTESAFDAATGSVLSRERLRLGNLVLSDKYVTPDPAQTEAALAKALSTRLDVLDWRESVLNLQARAAWMRKLHPEFPDISRNTLAANTAIWLAPYLAGMKNIREAKTLDIANLLRDFIGHQAAKQLDALLPAELKLPNGTLQLDYTGPVPMAAARAKLFYGLDATPQLAAGKIPLQITLLSPAGRPIAITPDLANFWRGAWPEIRREMRGRYPKHDWPERPWE